MANTHARARKRCPSMGPGVETGRPIKVGKKNTTRKCPCTKYPANIEVWTAVIFFKKIKSEDGKPLAIKQGCPGNILTR